MIVIFNKYNDHEPRDRPFGRNRPGLAIVKVVLLAAVLKAALEAISKPPLRSTLWTVYLGTTLIRLMTYRHHFP